MGRPSWRRRPIFGSQVVERRSPASVCWRRRMTSLYLGGDTRKPSPSVSPVLQSQALKSRTTILFGVGRVRNMRRLGPATKVPHALPRVQQREFTMGLNTHKGRSITLYDILLMYNPLFRLFSFRHVSKPFSTPPLLQLRGGASLPGSGLPRPRPRGRLEMTILTGPDFVGWNGLEPRRCRPLPGAPTCGLGTARGGPRA